jgi:transmembrane sensor
MSAGRSLGRHVQPPLTDARIDRQWRGVLELTQKGQPVSLLRLSFAFVAVVVVAASAVLFFAPRSPVAEQGTVVETSAANPQPLRLSDGSQIELARLSRLQVAVATPEQVRVVLARGALTADVVKSDTRVFSVTAGGYDVIVHGTKFQVALVGSPNPALTVLVERGRVEVRRTGATSAGRFLNAGEGWAEPAVQGPAPAPAAPATTTEVVAPNAEGTAAPAPVEAPPAKSGPSSAGSPPKGDAPSSGAPPAASGAPASDFTALIKARRYREAFDSLGEGGFPREVAAADARRLLELADVARLSGHPRDAAQALDRLRLSFRTDPRAGLAALELGRLRMDAFGDKRGALSAFDDAVTLSKAGAVREDAEARRVQVLEALGDLARCRSLRDAYLTRFPNGVHASSMRARCAPK